MSNLLPSDLRMNAWRTTRSRMLIATASLLLVTAAIAAIALLPSLLVFAVTRSDSGVSTRSQESAQDTQSLADAQILVAQLSPILATSTPARITADVIAVRPKGVSIEHVVYSGGTPARLVVSGTATNRDAVNEYRATLSTDTRFTSVTVPINALVGSSDNSFSLTLTGAF